MEQQTECEVSYEEWQKMTEVRLIDIREKDERMMSNIGGEWIPMASLTYHCDSFPIDKPVILYCQSGRRSIHATQALRQILKRDNIFSLKGGVKYVLENRK